MGGPFFLRVSPFWVSASYVSPILPSEHHLSSLPLCSHPLTSLCCLLPSLVCTIHSFSSSLSCMDISFFLAFLALSSQALNVLVFSQVLVTCCCEVSVGCLASVQGFVSSPFPSLHLLAQTSAITLRLAAGGCLAVKWVVCEGVGILLVPCSLASGLGLGVECCYMGG